MDRPAEICCCRCGQALNLSQVYGLQSITGMSVEQLAQYNLRLYCERCERFRKQKSNRVGLLVLVGLLLALLLLLLL